MPGRSSSASTRSDRPASRKAAYGDPNNPYDFGETNGDIPSGPGDLAWTNYGTGNLDSSGVKDIIHGDSVINKTIAFGEYIGQHNNGNHTTLFDDMDSEHGGAEHPGPGGRPQRQLPGLGDVPRRQRRRQLGKHIKGYFVSPFVNKRLTIKACGFGGCPRYLGSPTINLVN